MTRLFSVAISFGIGVFLISLSDPLANAFGFAIVWATFIVALGITALYLDGPYNR